MKKVCILIMLLACLAGCSQKAVDLDPQTAAKTLTDASTGDSPLSKLDLDAALALYGLTSGEVADGSIYIGNSGTVDEVSVWKAVSDSAANTIEDRVRDRIATQKDVYADYRPDEIPKLNNAVVVRRGQFVILFIDGDSKAAQKAVDSLF